MFVQQNLTRRTALTLGGLGLSAAALGKLPSAALASEQGGGRAKSCIVLFAWGGMSHIDTWDMKTRATDIAGEFRPIATSVPGIEVCEHLPKLAERMHQMAVVRSVHHKASDHREAAYWNLTGHQPRLLSVPAVPPNREDWPSLGAMVAKVQHEKGAEASALPGTLSLPYPIADRGLLNGQYGGFLGVGYDPVYLRPPTGTAYGGVSPEAGTIDLKLAQVEAPRFQQRRSLLNNLEKSARQSELSAATREQGLNMLLDDSIRSAFDLSQEPERLHEAYGRHICGQSVLQARRLTEAGVKLVTVYCSAGDLNGSVGDHWDTHGNGFARMKEGLLPPLDRAMSALLDDLSARGRLEETLVVLLTEFGRTPQINGGKGRDHFPNCYSVVFAGGGIAGGRVYGSSDRIGAEPASEACGPEDLHATIFQALGIDPGFTIVDLQGRPHPICRGRPLPLL